MAKGPHWSLGARIHAARARRGFNFAQLAAYCGVTEVAARNWERGTSRPSPERLVKLAEGFGVSAELLRDGGVAWDEALVHIQPLPGPHVFQWPTQFPQETGAPDESIVPPFREAEAPLPDAPTRKVAPKNARDEGTPPISARRLKSELQPLIERGECCSLCLAAVPTIDRYCPECRRMFGESESPVWLTRLRPGI